MQGPHRPRLTGSAVGGLLLAVALCLPSAAARADVRQLSLPVNDILYDPASKKIYASVPSAAGSIGNSIIAIDPVTGTTGPSVSVGSEPGKLALSDDGQYLYVSLEGAGAVRRVDLPAYSADLQFWPATDDRFGPLSVGDMEVLPGQPEAVAIAHKADLYGSQYVGVAIYDNGVPRPAATTPYQDLRLLEFTADGASLYGLNMGGNAALARMSVSASGVVLVSPMAILLPEHPGEIKRSGNLFFTATGRVIDPEAGQLVGTFAGVGPGARVAPDLKTGRVFFLTGERAARKLLAFDAGTFALVGTMEIPGVPEVTGPLIRWGEDGLAFVAIESGFVGRAERIFLVRSPLVAPRTPSNDTPAADGQRGERD